MYLTIINSTIPMQILSSKSIAISGNKSCQAFVELNILKQEMSDFLFSLHFIIFLIWELMIWKIRIIVCYFTLPTAVSFKVKVKCFSACNVVCKFRSPLSVVHEWRERLSNIESLVLCKFFGFFRQLMCLPEMWRKTCIVFEQWSMLYFAFGRWSLYLFDICLSSTYLTQLKKLMH